MHKRVAFVVVFAVAITSCSGPSNETSPDGTSPSTTVDAASVVIDIAQLVVPPVSDGLALLHQYQAEEVTAGLLDLGVSVPAEAFAPPSGVFDEARRLVDDLTAEANLEPVVYKSSEPLTQGVPKLVPAVYNGSELSSVDTVTGAAIGFTGLWLESAARGAQDFDTGTKAGSAVAGATGIDLSLQVARHGNRISATGGFGLSQNLTVEGQTVTLAVIAKATLSVDLCPDPSGIVNVEFHVEAKTSGNVPGAGSISSDLNIDGTAVAQVDDSAEIAGVDVDVTSAQGARTLRAGTEANPKASYYELRWQLGLPGGDTHNLQVKDVQPVRVSSQPPDTVEESFRLTMLGAAFAVETALGKARSHWQHGGCVQLTIDAPARVSPKSESPVTAMVRHLQEGQDLELPVMATVTAGGESIDPASASGKPASFTYTAPDRGGVTSTVSFEVRSRRGADQKSVDIEIEGAWVASTVSGRITISGTVNDVNAPFSLEGEFQGGSATLTFTPTDDSSGELSYTGGGSGVTVSGEGTYTIVDDGDGSYTLTYSSHGCTSVGTCADQDAVISLDPQQ